MQTSNGGSKYLSIIASITLLVIGAFGTKLWEIGTSVVPRQEVSQALLRHDEEDDKKFSTFGLRLNEVEVTQRLRTDQLSKLETQYAVLDITIKEMRRQYDEFRVEIRRDVIEIKQLLRLHMDNINNNK